MGLSIKWCSIFGLGFITFGIILFQHLSLDHDHSSNVGLLREHQEYCPSLAPKFHFQQPLDDPILHNGQVCDIAVFTVVFGRVDSLYDYSAGEVDDFRIQEKKLGVHSCWFAFLDEDSIVQSLDDKPDPKCYFPNICSPKVVNKNIWNVMVMPRDALPFPFRSTKNSRVPKMLGFRAFGHASLMLYFDGKKFWKPLTSFWQFIQDSKKIDLKKQSLSSLNNNKNDDDGVWISPRHPSRSSVYEEARCVRLLELGGDDVLNQMNEYFEKGLPLEGSVPPLGLIEGEWSLRSLNSNLAARLGCEWFREYSRWNHTRDQLSFNYAAWSLSHSIWMQNEINKQQTFGDLLSLDSIPFVKYSDTKPLLGDIKRTSPFYVHRLPISVCRSGYDHGYPAAEGLERIMAKSSNPNGFLIHKPYPYTKEILCAFSVLIILLILYILFTKVSGMRTVKSFNTL